MQRRVFGAAAVREREFFRLFGCTQLSPVRIQERICVAAASGRGFQRGLLLAMSWGRLAALVHPGSATELHRWFRKRMVGFSVLGPSLRSRVGLSRRVLPGGISVLLVLVGSVAADGRS
jgi:hypothetical protein